MSLPRLITIVVLSSLLGATLALVINRWIQLSNSTLPNSGGIGHELLRKLDSQDGANSVLSRQFSLAAKVASPAIVLIKTSSDQEPEEAPERNSFFDAEVEEGPQNASGSGVIITQDGFIVTNHHVVEDVEDIEVILEDRRAFKAKRIGVDPSSDLALLKIDASDLPYLPFGNSDSLNVGDWVLALGNPYELDGTVTAGIVSAKARNIRLINDGKGSSIESFIQSDAATNSGNSGGALINLRGEIVGINTAIASFTGSYSGYSFAIPSALAKKVVQDFLDFGEVRRGYIGIQVQTVDDYIAKKYRLSSTNGVFITGILEGFASQLKTGDVITHFNGTPINTESMLMEQVGRRRPGDKVELIFVRKGKTETTTITLKSRQGETKVVTEERPSLIIEPLRTEFEDLTPQEAKEWGIESGVRVLDIEAGPLYSLGIRKKQIILSIDKKPLKSAKQLEEAIKNLKGGILLEVFTPQGNRDIKFYALSQADLDKYR